MNAQLADKQAPRMVEGFTIDGPQSRDLDDALWLEERGAQTLVRVCIPNVAAAIQPDSPLDNRARERGFTRYFAVGNAPMLSRLLSEDRLSLLPHEPRRVFNLEMLLDSHLDCCHFSVRQAVLESMAQLTYAQVAAIIGGQAAPAQQAITPGLHALGRLSLRLLEKRRQRGELAYYDLRFGWALSEEGNLKHLSVDEANIGYVIVQELMLLANRTIAEYLLRANVPTLFRNHEASVAAPNRMDLAKSIESAFAHPEYFDFNTLRQRLNLMLSRAEYGPQVKGHYGLNLPAYLHFTSPLRRYADLVNQRILLAYLSGEPAPYTMEQLEAIGAELNALVNAERERKHQSYKQRKEREIERNLQAEADYIAKLPDKDAHRVLKRALEETEPPKSLVLGLDRRCSEQTISLKEIFTLLFECPAEGDAWQALRRLGLSWLRQHPEEAVSALAMGVGLRDWPATNYKYAGCAAGFTCQAALTVSRVEYRTAQYYSSSKKTAQQKAALALCHLLYGAELPEELTEYEYVPELSTLPLDLPNKLPDLIFFDWKSLEPRIKIGDYVGALISLCQKTQRKQPRFQLEMIGKAGEPCYLCRLALNWPEVSVDQQATGRNKQEAKQRVAQAALTSLQAAHQ